MSYCYFRTRTNKSIFSQLQQRDQTYSAFYKTQQFVKGRMNSVELWSNKLNKRVIDISYLQDIRRQKLKESKYKKLKDKQQRRKREKCLTNLSNEIEHRYSITKSRRVKNQSLPQLRKKFNLLLHSYMLNTIDS